MIRTKIKKFIAYFLLGTFLTFLVSSCIHAPKQPWTPKYRSYKKSMRKR